MGAAAGRLRRSQTAPADQSGGYGPQHNHFGRASSAPRGFRALRRRRCLARRRHLLFSEPQPRLRRLIDLSTCDWDPLRVDEAGLFVAATCTIATLDAFEPPAAWIAAELIGFCCRAFLASFKIWNTATVGGNLCMALPAGPMISLCAALDGVCVIWTPDGGERRLSIFDFVLGPQRTALRPGELLRGNRGAARGRSCGALRSAAPRLPRSGAPAFFSSARRPRSAASF